jgi:hypothetical protein
MPAGSQYREKLGKPALIRRNESQMVGSDMRTKTEADFLRVFESLPDREKAALLAAIERLADGQPIDDAVAEFYIDIGETDREARRLARVAIAESANGSPNPH